MIYSPLKLLIKYVHGRQIFSNFFLKAKSFSVEFGTSYFVKMIKEYEVLHIINNFKFRIFLIIFFIKVHNFIVVVLWYVLLYFFDYITEFINIHIF